MIGREARLFLCALQLLTRLPAPRLAGFEPGWIARSAPYYPVVGWIVGAICAGVLLAASRLWPQPVPAVLAVAAGLLVTGGLHEDGLADTVDGLFGGHDPQHRLDIMKQSQIGGYAAMALWAALTIKAAALAALPPVEAALALILTHGAARAAPVAIMAALPYARDPRSAKLETAGLGASRRTAIAALLLGVLPLALPSPSGACLGAAFAALGAAALALAARRLIGGFTGDVLGAAEQIAEVGLLLGFAARTLTP